MESKTMDGNFEKNVFELWVENDKKIPFMVRRWSWHFASYFVVKEINVKWDYYEKTGKLYGNAFGDMYRQGKLMDTNIGLNCAGCYQWQLVKDEEI